MLKVISLKELIAQWNQSSVFLTGIPQLDQVTGGAKAGHLYMIWGDEGVGKTWVCLQVIQQLFRTHPNAEVIYVDFEGHLRIRNVERVIPDKTQLAQISMVTPTSLMEQMIFVRKLIDQQTEAPRCDLMIIDTILGSPLDAMCLRGKERQLWYSRLEDHAMGLRTLATQWDIPVFLVNHLASTEGGIPLPYAQSIFKAFVSVDIRVDKTLEGHSLHVFLFHESIASIPWDLSMIASGSLLPSEEGI